MNKDDEKVSFTKAEYYASLGLELQSIKNRVRNLIGKRGWGEEGRYKEIILMNMIIRYLPKNYSIGTGYVISTDKKGVTGSIKQIDIIIYDNSYPVFFKEHDFVILPPDSVRGVIEVKSMIWKRKEKEFKESLKKMYDNANFIICNSAGSHLFNGIFSYELDSNLTPRDVLNMVESVYIELKKKNKERYKYPPNFPNYICVDKDIFAYGFSHKYRCCKTDDCLATFWFISLLLKSLDFQKTGETFWSEWGDIASREICSFSL